MALTALARNGGRGRRRAALVAPDLPKPEPERRNRRGRRSL